MASQSSSSLAAPVAKPVAPGTKVPRREQHRRFDSENPRSMIDSLNAFRKDDILTDLTLKSSGKSFPCHKVILASTSEYFKAALTSGFRETRSGEIVFPNIHPEILEDILNYIYGQEVTIEASNVLQLHSASHLLQINGLIKITKDFMLINFQQCYMHQSFLKFPSPHLVEYISERYLEVRNEDEVYKAVMRWVRHDLPKRKESIADLMAHVRLPYCTKSFFCQVIMQDDQISKYCQDILSEAISFHLVPSSKSTLQVKPREGSMTMGLEEHSVIKYITKGDGVMLSSRTDKHEYSLKILGELPLKDLVSGHSVCASDTTVVITGGTTGAKRKACSFSWSLNTLTRTWSQMPKLPYLTRDHPSIRTDGVTFTQSNDEILMLEPKAEHWKFFLDGEDVQVVDGNSKYLLMIQSNQDYYLFDRNKRELLKLNKPTNTSCLLKFIDDKLLALSKGLHQFKSFYRYNFTSNVWKYAGFVRAKCDGVDEKSKVCVWKENLVLTYPKGLAIFNPDTAILRHFVSCKIDKYDKCHIFPIFVSESD